MSRVYTVQGEGTEYYCQCFIICKCQRSLSDVVSFCQTMKEIENQTVFY